MSSFQPPRRRLVPILDRSSGQTKYRYMSVGGCKNSVVSYPKKPQTTKKMQGPAFLPRKKFFGSREAMTVLGITSIGLLGIAPPLALAGMIAGFGGALIMGDKSYPELSATAGGRSSEHSTVMPMDKATSACQFNPARAHISQTKTAVFGAPDLMTLIRGKQ